jgi:polyhydroxyalkanoate synthesis regulator phasin
VRDALKNYLTLASGLTEVGRQRAMAASKALVAQGEATAEQVGSLAEDLIQTSKNNRDLITALVRSEVEKALNTVGLATADSVERLTKRLQSLESALRDASKPEDAPAEPAAKPASEGAAAKSAAKRVAAKSSKAGSAALGAEAAKKTAVPKPMKVSESSAAKPAKPAKPAKKSGGTAAAKPAKKPAKKASS